MKSSRKDIQSELLERLTSNQILMTLFLQNDQEYFISLCVLLEKYNLLFS